VEARSLKFVAEACAGELRFGSGETLALRVCTDSRLVQPGDLFFALRGERFDGHDFLPEVARKGTAGVVAGGARIPPGWSGCALIAVDDPRLALGRLAARYRLDFQLPVVVVGGSNGKTTTKDLIASVLSQRLATVRSEASFNNDVGVPLTLLGLEKAHQAAVLEVGTNHVGELAPLVRMIQPSVGVITNLGREHLEFFGDLAGVAEEEGWVAELLPADGTFITNGDSEWAAKLAARTRAKVVRVGLSESNDWRAQGIRPDERGATFRVEAPRPEFCGDYRIRLLGRHQVANALLAIAVGEELGLGRAEIQRGLGDCAPAKMRLQLWEANGVRVLDDTYNANADSMIAALRTLMELPCDGRRIAVLGDMAELGAHSEATHAEVGRCAAELGVGQLIAVGQMAGIMSAAARAAGLLRVFEFAEVESAAGAVKRFFKPGDLVLLKASRATRLERVVNVLGAPNGK
jgi:UDP-N-acetylmuramoyl-tripeptide--D-alanyl-D-alanine ligase